MFFKPVLIMLCALGLVALAVPARAAPCSLDGVSLQEGESRVFYSARFVAPGQSCESVAAERRCTTGGLQGPAGQRYPRCITLEGFLGVNTNRKPADLDPVLLERTRTKWVRTNVEILAYMDQHTTGEADPKWDFADWDSYIAAASRENGKSILNLMWNFADRDQHPPKPGSKREKALFEYLDTQILDKLAAHIDILTTGNEPFVNTAPEDWVHQDTYGGIPAVVFYTRVTEHVNAYLIDRGLRERVGLYVGAFTRLHTENMQAQPAVQALLTYVETTGYVDGLDMHTHVLNLKQIDKALTFARGFTTKPIIVTEFTFVWRMKKAVESDETLGPEFAGRWGRDPDQQIEDYMACDVFGLTKGCKGNGPVSKAEWDDFFATRDWFIDHFILQADAIFRQHGVRGATFGLVQNQPRRPQLRTERPPWYMGFLFSAASVEPGPGGLPQPNYQYLDDFLTIQQHRAEVARH